MRQQRMRRGRGDLIVRRMRVDALAVAVIGVLTVRPESAGAQDAGAPPSAAQDQEQSPSQPAGQRGSAGESCMRAADCATGLKCIAQVCTSGEGSPAQAPPSSPTPPPEPAPAPAPQPATTLPPPPPPVPVDEHGGLMDPFAVGPRFQIGAGVGYGGGTVLDKPGVAFGAFGMYRLSESRGNTWGLSFLLARASSDPKAVGAYLAGLQMGSTVYVQGLGGIVNGPKELDPDPTTGIAGYGTTTSLGLGGALGLHLEFTRAVGLNAEVFLAKGFDSDGSVGGVLIGPVFQAYSRPKPGP